MELRFHPEALDDLRHSADFYVARSPQTAQRFAVAVDAAIDSILGEAKHGVEASGSRDRTKRVDGFPFQIVYRTSGDVVDVIAVAHHSRRPGYWKRRR